MDTTALHLTLSWEGTSDKLTSANAAPRLRSALKDLQGLQDSLVTPERTATLEKMEATEPLKKWITMALLETVSSALLEERDLVALW